MTTHFKSGEFSSFNIGVIGCGVVGEATARGFAKKGHCVQCIDKNEEKIHHLRADGFQAFHISDTQNIQVRFLFVCINTPPCADGRASLKNMLSGMQTVGELLRTQKEQCVVVIRSTVPPLTIESKFVPLLEEHSGKVLGDGWSISHNPEYLRAISSEDDFSNPWATVLGIQEGDDVTREALKTLYEPFGGRLFFMTIEEAGLAKYVNNLRNALVISFSNEIWQLGEKLGIDANKALEVSTHTAESAWNPQYGCVGGFPYGGTCLPKDTTALHAFAREQGINMPLLEEMMAVNERMAFLAQNGLASPPQIAGHKWKKSPHITSY